MTGFLFGQNRSIFEREREKAGVVEKKGGQKYPAREDTSATATLARKKFYTRPRRENVGRSEGQRLRTATITIQEEN
jgi:hypothetical protein